MTSLSIHPNLRASGQGPELASSAVPTPREYAPLAPPHLVVGSWVAAGWRVKSLISSRNISMRLASSGSAAVPFC